MATVWEKIDKEHRQFIRLQLSKYRKDVYAAIVCRDGEKCDKCGAVGSMDIDHIKQVSNGGLNTLDNLRLLCASCNVESRTLYIKTGRMCCICGSEPIDTFGSKWLCKKHMLEAHTTERSLGIGREKNLNMLMEKYKVVND